MGTSGKLGSSKFAGGFTMELAENVLQKNAAFSLHEVIIEQLSTERGEGAFVEVIIHVFDECLKGTTTIVMRHVLVNPLLGRVFFVSFL